MNIVYTTTFNAQNVHNWSGTPYFMSRGLVSAEVKVDYIGSLVRKLPPFFKVKQTFKKIIYKERECPHFNMVAAKHYSSQVSQQLKKSNAHVVISPLINPIAYLDCEQPIILWTDALYADLVGFYPSFSNHSKETISQANQITSDCLSRLSLAIFSSDWAAQGAIKHYHLPKEKVKVVPFGANINFFPTLEEVKTIIKNRATDKIKLLFFAKSWERKGGNIVLSVAKALYEAGESVELIILGYLPEHLNPVPPYVKALGFVSKHVKEGEEMIRSLLAEAHFLFVPSRAEAYGIVFCEANAYGLPCITSDVGGITTIIKNDINGMAFAFDTTVATYCDYIINLMSDYKAYEALALSAYEEFITRLNWQVATDKVNSLLKDI